MMSLFFITNFKIMNTKSIGKAMTFMGLALAFLVIGVPILFLLSILGIITSFIWVPALTLCVILILLMKFTKLGLYSDKWAFKALQSLFNSKYGSYLWPKIYDYISRNA
jgi:type IV secretory pathway VirB3-like protein